MKKIFFLLSVLMSSVFTKSSAQNTFPSTGNVGIGTSTPTYLLDVNGNSRISGSLTLSKVYGAGSDLIISQNTSGTAGISLNTGALDGTSRVYIQSTGYIGIGTTSPYSLLHMKYNNSTALSARNFITIDNRGANASYSTSHVLGGLLFAAYRDVRDPANVAGIWSVRTPLATGLASAGDLVFGASNNYGTNITTDNALPTERMRILSNGNVLIGQSTQSNSGYILDVNGTMRADQVVVNTSGADYVFDSSYYLPSLNLIEKFVKTQHHLPDIQSAQQMQKEGLKLGDNQILLLRKIEELTLYLIQENHDREEQKNQIADQQNKLDALAQLLKKQSDIIKLLQEKLANTENSK